jgi:N-dimethylarginine dimethylaminohydrolase
MATLLIDDQRDLPAGRVARTYQEGIAALGNPLPGP